MKHIRSEFRVRCKEITDYLRMVRFIEQSGASIVSRDGKQHYPLDLRTRHVLKASVYLYLYNLVESTVTACFLRVAREIEHTGVGYSRLIDEWQSTLLRSIGKAGEPLNPEARLSNLRAVVDRVLSGDPISFQPILGGGNLDELRIEVLLKRTGVELVLSPDLKTRVKRHVVDDKGPLSLVKIRRNELAHGLVSFGDCGRDVTVADLRSWTCTVICYLSRLVTVFTDFVANRRFERTGT